MRKSINQIFSNNPELLEDNTVQELIEYARNLEDEVVENQQSKTFSFEIKLTILVNELYNDIKTLFRDEEESIRFNEIPRPDFREALVNLRNYFKDFGIDNNYDFDR